jgi:hypothetical protein
MLVELVRTYVYAEPISGKIENIKQSKICKNDAESIAVTRKQIDKDVSALADKNKWIINLDTATESIEKTDFVDTSTGENAADQANAKNAAEGTSDV